MTTAELREFVDCRRNLASDDDYAALASRYAIRRTDYRFWSHSGASLVAYRDCASTEAALFNHSENR